LSEADAVNDVGKALVVLGLLIALSGLLLLVVGRVPWIGRLPGDIHLQRGNWSFYVPLGTSIVLSLLLTLLFWLFGRR
jgi:membrane protein implicated in regulation of membrane protease activity